MAGRSSFIVVAAALALLLACLTNGLPVCIDSDAPLPLNTSLAFCSSFLKKQSSCCNATIDQQLKIKFQSFNVSDVQCAGFLKQILCAQCDPYAADLFGLQSQQELSVPILCNSTSASSASANSYCANVWNACKNVPVDNSPFMPSLQGPGGGAQPPISAPQAAAKLTDLWKSQNEFCKSLGGSGGSGEFCYSGEKFAFLNKTSPQTNVQGICFENIGTGVYLNMVPHPDGSNRVFLSSQGGEIWLATLPEEGSGDALKVNKSAPFLDLSDRVISTGEYGLLGVALHPNFKNNGRFFVSYNCDKGLWPDCGGRCSCNADTGCTLSQLGPEAGATPCQISSVIAEYSANTSSSSPFEAVTADPNEVRRVFTMGLPYTTHHAGQILFGPTDNYLYFMMGDGGSTGDPFNFAQNKRSLLGKIIRLDVDNIPSAQEISKLQYWGNYSIPADNPFIDDNLSEPEIWVYGLRNPWRCAFDKINPSYFFCADVGQETYEEVDLITRGGNYGWRVYEGTALYKPPSSPGGNTSVNSIQPIFPILEYPHNFTSAEGAASITGGYVSRSTQDACLYGRYVYADLYGGGMWAAAETPPGSGNFSTERVKFTCSANSSLKCVKTADGRPNFLYVFSYGQDNSNNLYVLSATGVYKVVSPKACNYACNATLPVTASSPTIVSSPVPSPLAAPSPKNSSTSQASESVRLLTGALLLAVLFHLFLAILL